MLFFLSCSKESVLPDEYQYLIGTWTLKNCIVSADFYTPHYPYSNSDTLPPDSFGFDQSIKIDDNSILFYSENTIVQVVDNFISVEVNTGTYSGVTETFFYIIYRDEIGRKKAASISYIPDNDILQIFYHLYDSESGTYQGPRYQFNYCRG